MHRRASSGALGRFRVIDLTQVRAGPNCVKQFADFGADVIKVEPPDSIPRGELYVGARDGADMQNLHRNKRSITLNLKAPQGREALLRLVATADVVVENFRPDVKVRLGLDYDTLRAVNPCVVLVSISGFGQDGPYRHRPGFDQIIQGMCGLMSATGAPEGGPMRAGAAVVDVTAGLYAAIGALTALLERETSGQGQWVQISLLHAGIGLMDFQAARYLVDGAVATRVGNDHPTSMPTSAYKAADGYLNVAASGEGMWKQLCRAIGREDLVAAPEFDVQEKRAQNRAKLNALINAALQKKKSAEWIEILNAAGVPTGPIYAMDQVFADPQVKHIGAAAEVNHPRLGKFRVINQAARLSRTPATMKTATPEVGQHTDEVLAELGFEKKQILEMRKLGII